LIIDGTLIIKPTSAKKNFVIRCKTIWVRAGVLKTDGFGNKKQSPTLLIELTGNMDDEN
jgi:hypothetical protein